MAAPVISPELQWSDANGTPYAGGSIADLPARHLHAEGHVAGPWPGRAQYEPGRARRRRPLADVRRRRLPARAARRARQPDLRPARHHHRLGRHGSRRLRPHHRRRGGSARPRRCIGERGGSPRGSRQRGADRPHQRRQCGEGRARGRRHHAADQHRRREDPRHGGRGRAHRRAAGQDPDTATRHRRRRPQAGVVRLGLQRQSGGVRDPGRQHVRRDVGGRHDQYDRLRRLAGLPGLGGADASRVAKRSFGWRSGRA
jgi:hypothetical protein